MTQVNVVRALFVDEGKPDAEARVLIEPEGDISFSLLFGSDDKLIASALPGNRVLQLAESLQFIADTVSATVPGRLTPFARNWNRVASELATRTSGDVADKYEGLEDEDATVLISDMLAQYMAYAHRRGLPIAQHIEQYEDTK